MARVSFVFHRSAFSEQVLKSRRIQQLSHEACERAVGGNCRIMVRDQSRGRSRNGVSMITDGPHETHSGALTQALGRVRI